MFEGFDLDHIDVGAATLRVRHGGSGPPVVLLHGHPRTHVTWQHVAADLAADHTVVCPDLRGYGRSSKPPAGEDFSGYSKRAMAGDIVALMTELGHSRFAVAGHDRGCYVAMRLALDHPYAVSHLAVLDGVPIGEALSRAGSRFAQLWWHWFFLGQTAKPAERVINADPEAWYGLGDSVPPEEREAIYDPETVHAMCCDYRAGLRADREADDADWAEGRIITCPTLFAWSTRDDMEELYGDPLSIWRDWAADVEGVAIDSGHHMAEENPQALTTALRALLRRS
ncbi:alpha/beta fold hydrolase [Actinoplanes friuliensis]|uniref:Alpha/beta hydrolase fold protein n=1 Tax=Actinoplanes friuliensis DSM 7358 TaxID=1246995 RepID=U5W3E2_9ACTN|nr:alpha/beta hydrolase [Actinoplanes friuliensis]AGZ43629.1 alpha/beta hydrolase fold protein [Actinoplanes friuliensis DSM 7358]